jgi:tRNA pseudouridine38-40 synthase
VQHSPLVQYVRHFFHIGFDGFNFLGWQKLPQTKGRSVQEIMEFNLSKVLKTQLTIVGCGRTDAHVHAGQFFFHVDIEKSWDFDLQSRLNMNLPKEIAVFDILQVDDSSHARFSALERTYNYFIHTSRDPYLANISSYYAKDNFDIDLMRKAAALLTNYEDYHALSKNIAEGRSTICKVSAAKLYADKNGEWIRFEISANRFINGMIRIVAEKLLSIGRHTLSLSEFENYLITGKRPPVNRLAFPQGLHLTKVTYPFIDLPTKSKVLQALMR